MALTHRPYYGWANLAFAALAMVATLPGRTQGLGLVTEPLLRDFQLDRVAYANLNLWATLIGSAFCLPFGRWIDRFGSRLILTLLLAALGASTLAMSSGASLTLLWITVTLTRGFGQSALSVASLALVGKWFSRRLHVAMGIYALAVGMGFVTAFPSVGQAIQTWGWRTAWSGVGYSILLFAPLAWLVVRNHPQHSEAGDVEHTHEPGDLTVRQTLVTPAFWTFALSSALFGLVYSGISLFNESILAQRGFPASAYYQVLVVSTLLGLAANFAGGWLATWWPLQQLMGIGMAVLGVALVALPFVTSMTHVYLYAAGMGISGGVVTVVFFSVWAKVFGRTHLGRIQGYAQMLTVFASAVGPLLLASTLARTGSYDSIFFLLAACTAALGLCSWFVPLPRRELTPHPPLPPPSA